MVTPELRAQREATVWQHVNAENAHDADGVVATFHHARYEVAPFGEPNDGAEAVHGLMNVLFGAFPDLNVAVQKLYHADDAVICEVRMTATHRGPFAGLEPTGKSVDVPMVGIFVFDEARLICEKVYFDMATIVRQIQG